MQILGINFLIVFLAGSLVKNTFAYHLGWSITEIAVLATALVVIAPAVGLGAAIQRGSYNSVPRWRLMRADANANGALAGVPSFGWAARARLSP